METCWYRLHDASTWSKGPRIRKVWESDSACLILLFKIWYFSSKCWTFHSSSCHLWEVQRHLHLHGQWYLNHRSAFTGPDGGQGTIFFSYFFNCADFCLLLVFFQDFFSGRVFFLFFWFWGIFLLPNRVDVFLKWWFLQYVFLGTFPTFFFQSTVAVGPNLGGEVIDLSGYTVEEKAKRSWINTFLERFPSKKVNLKKQVP